MPNQKNLYRLNNLKGGTFFEQFFQVGLFVLLFGYFIFHQARVPMIISAAFGLFSALLFTINKAKTQKVKIPACWVWYFLFFIYAECSSFWAISPSVSARHYLVIMILVLLISFLIPQYADDINQAETILKIFVYSSLGISAIQLIFTPAENWFSGYFGSAVGGNNTNHFGFIVMSSAIISFYFAYLKRIKIHYLFTFIFFFLCILSSSRKAILMAIFGICLIILFAFKKRHHLLHLGVLLIISVISIILIMEIEFLYNIVGFRFSSLFAHYVHDYAFADGSLETREYFIEFARLLFEEKPIFGQGFANFSILLGLENNRGLGVYAHNNYWEILADLGIVGFIVYYWFYLFLFIKLVVKLFKNKDNSIFILALSLLVSEIVLEWGLVSMATMQPQFVMVLIYICSSVSTSTRKYHYIYDGKLR